MTSAFEICEAMILNIKKAPEQDFVFASGRTIKLNELVLRVASQIGITKKISNLEELMQQMKTELSPIVISDPSKARTMLGWEAISTPEKVLIEIISQKGKGKTN